MTKKRVLVFASGSATGGGSGFANLVRQSRKLDLPFEVISVVTSHINGGVAEHAQKLDIPFMVCLNPLTPHNYERLFSNYKADLVVLSGWLKPVAGLPPEKVINIHPGPLPQFGGKGMYGHHVHEAVIAAHREGRISQSAVCMHFVPPYEKTASGDNYDSGPVFAEVPVEIYRHYDAEALGRAVNAVEHAIQPAFTALVAEGRISLIRGRVVMDNQAWREGKNLPKEYL